MSTELPTAGGVPQGTRQPTATQELISSLEGTLTLAFKNHEQLTVLRDRLLGPQPEQVDNARDKVEPASSLAFLASLAADLRSVLTRTNDRIEELSNV